MESQIALHLDMIEQADWGYLFRLNVANDSLHSLFIPTLKITDLKFVPIEISKPRESASIAA